MSFWDWLNNTRPDKGSTDDSGNYRGGDPDGVEFTGDPIATRSLPFVRPSGWDGWPSSWPTPNWGSTDLNRLIDVAWNAIDTNASIIAGFPVYQLQNGKIVPSLPWMSNPDPTIYNSWFDFAKELFWAFHLGEAFVLPMSFYAPDINGNRYPRTMRVIPSWLVNVELRGGLREYTIGGQDVTGEILHIRYQSNTADAHGHGPLECAGARMTAAGLLQRYAHRLAETGGTPNYWLEVKRRISSQREAQDILDQWVASRMENAGYPALLTGEASFHQSQSMSARDMALLELSQFNESRIAVLLGLPPFLAGLPAGSGGDGSLTYQNVSQLFSFHDKASLQWKVVAVMSALSNWALPRGTTVECNRDEYSRPSMKERFESYKIAIEAGFMTGDEVRAMERMHGPISASALTGGTMTGNSSPAPAQPAQEASNAVGNP